MDRHGWAARRAAWAAAVSALAAFALLAGCAGPAAPPRPAPPSSPYFESSLHGGDRFYAFDHPGGDLAFHPSEGTVAEVDLFDGADRRVGSFGVRTQENATDVRLDGLAPGEYVARVRLDEGDLRIDAGGTEPVLRPLRGHAERVVIAEAPYGPLPPLPLLPERVERRLSVDLARTPASLRLLADGSHSFLRLRLDGAGGAVLEAESFGAPVPAFGCSLCEVPATVRVAAARDGHLEGELEAEDFQGALVIESASYSRAAPPGQEAVRVLGDLGDRPRFSYGRLPAQPVAFQVAAGAHRIAFWQEASPSPDAWVVVFDPEDRKVATVPVPHGRTVALQVAGPGAFVAVALAGEVEMGADAAPADPALAPLRVRSEVVPREAAGREGGGYGQRNVTVEAARLFDVRPATVEGPYQPVVVCGGDGVMRIEQGGETVGAWGSGDGGSPWFGPYPPVGVFLAGGPVSVWGDGFGGGSGCPHEGAELLSYERP